MAKRFLSNVNINDQYTLPSSDGTSGQIIQTDGAGSLSFIDNTADEARKIIFTVKNKDSISLSKGTVVHASPSATPPSGNVIEVIRADNNDSAKMPAIGVLNETLAVDAEGECVMLGSISGIATNSFNIGDELYVSNTPGEFTNTKPTGTSNLIQKIAIVIKSHSTNGLIEVFGAGRANDVPNLLTRDIAIEGADFAFGDSDQIQMGTPLGLRIQHASGGHSYIDGEVGNIYIRAEANDSDLIFQADNGAGGNFTYFRLDGGLATHDGTNTTQTVTVFPDNSKIQLGGDANGDLRLFHNGTNSIIANNTGNIEIINYSDDKDIFLKSDDGSGGVTTYYYIDGSEQLNRFTKNILLPDSINLSLGNSFDLKLYHDGTNSIVTNTTGDLRFIQNADDKDITFYNDDGSGNTTVYYYLDGSLQMNRFPVHVQLDDSVELRLGTNQDLRLFHTGTTGFIRNYTGHLYIDNNTDDGHIIFRSDDGSGGLAEYLKIDGSQEKIVVSKPLEVTGSVTATGEGVFSTLTLTDGNDDLTFTQSSDDWTINNAQQNNGITIYDGTGGVDINYAGSAYLQVDVNGVHTTSNIDFYVDTNTLYVDATNNLVGIGKTPSTYKLDVNGKIASNNYIIAGLGNGGVALTHNDGEGNANVTFNHVSGIPEQDGNSFRIRANTDSSTGAVMRFEIKEGVTADTAVDTIEVFRLDPDGPKVRQAGGGNISLQRDDASIVDGNPLGRIRFSGDDPTNDVFNRGAEIRATATGTWDTDNYPTKLTFFTTATNTDELALTLDESQNATFVGDIKQSTRTTLHDNGTITWGSSNNFGELSWDGDYALYRGKSGKGIKLQTNGSTTALTLDTSQNATFAGKVQFTSSADYIDVISGDLYIVAGSGKKNILYSNNVEAFRLDTSQNATLVGDLTVSGGDIILGGTGRIQGIDTVSANTDAANKLYVDNAVSANNELSEVLANGNTTGGTDIAISAGDDITFTSTSKAIFNSSLQIFNNGTNSFVESTGSGDLYIQQANDDKDIIFRNDNGSGGLATYFKLDGSLVNGTTTLGAVNFPDKSKLFFGTNSDLRIYHDGSNSYIDESGTGDLIIRANNLQLQNGTGTQATIKTFNGGSVELYHGGNKKLETTSTGVTVTGNVNAASFVGNAAIINQVAAGTSGGDIKFKNNAGTDRAIITDSGDVGIGTTSPAEKLEVSGGHIKITNSGNTNLYINANAANADATIFFEESDSVKAKIQHDASNDSLLFTDGSYTDTMTLKSGKVGIGETDPDTALDVVGGNADSVVDTLTLKNDNTGNSAGAGINFVVDGANDVVTSAIYGQRTAASYHQGSLQFLTRDASGGGLTERMRIDSLGNVLIGSGVYLSWGTNGAASIEGSTVSNKLQFRTNSADAMIIDSSQRVGIGTTNPLNRLAVSASNTGTQITTAPVGKFINTGNAFSKLIVGSDNANFDAVLSMDNDSTLANTKLRIYIGNGTSATTGHSNDHIVLQGDGNVGIGTSSPVGDLHVVGKTGTAGRIYISDVDDGTATGDSVLAMKSGIHAYYYNRDSGNLYLGTNDDPNQLIINNSGNVGIGTTTIGARLEVAATATTGVDIAYFSNSNSVQKAIFKLSDVGAGQLVLRDAGNVEDVLISSHGDSYFNGGDVGIGTSSPIGKFNVSKDSTTDGLSQAITINSSSVTTKRMNLGYVPSSNYAFIDVINYGIDNTSQALSLQPNGGKVGIGTTNPSHNLEISGVGGDGTPLLQFTGSASAQFNWISSAIHTNLAAGETSVHLFGQAESSKNSGYIGYLYSSSGSDSNAVTIGHYAANHLVNILANGNVGIGTTTINGFGSDTVLAVYNASTPRIKLQNSTTGTANTDGAELNMSGLDLIVENREAGNIRIFNNGSEKMRIDSSGGVEIYRAGNTNGGTLLLGPHGSGSTKWSYLAGTHYNQDTGSGNGSGSAGVALIGAYSDSSSNIVYIGGGPHEINAANAIIFNTHTSNTSTQGGTERMRIDANGNVDITGGGLIKGMSYLELLNNGGSDGTATSPRLYSPASGTLAFSGNGSERMRINSSGNVGIGTTSPSNKLHTVAASAITDESILRLSGGSTGFNGANDADIEHSIIFDACAYKATTGVIQREAAKIAIEKDGSWNEADIGTGTRASLVFSTNNGTIDSPDLAERMRIDSSGNIGIGTSSPSYLVHADATGTTDPSYIVASSGDIFVVGIGSQNSAGVAQEAFVGTLSNDDLKIKSNNTERIRVKNTGEVGIGTSSPAQKVHLLNGGFAYMRFTSQSYGAIGFDIGQHTNGNIYLNNRDNTSMVFMTNNATALTINNSQNAIFAGDITLEQAATPTIELKDTTNNYYLLLRHNNTNAIFDTHSSSYYEFKIGDSEKMRIDNSGRVGIGTTSPSYKLDVSGVIRATGDIIAFSDKRVKENIKTIENSLDKVDKLRGVEFNKIGEDKKSIGVIAQEIEKILPEVVSTDDNGMKSVAYGNITGVLIEAIKELKQEIETLKTQINK